MKLLLFFLITISPCAATAQGLKPVALPGPVAVFVEPVKAAGSLRASAQVEPVDAFRAFIVPGKSTWPFLSAVSTVNPTGTLRSSMKPIAFNSRNIKASLFIIDIKSWLETFDTLDDLLNAPDPDTSANQTGLDGALRNLQTLLLTEGFKPHVLEAIKAYKARLHQSQPKQQ